MFRLLNNHPPRITNVRLKALCGDTHKLISRSHLGVPEDRFSVSDERLAPLQEIDSLARNDCRLLKTPISYGRISDRNPNEADVYYA